MGKFTSQGTQYKGNSGADLAWAKMGSENVRRLREAEALKNENAVKLAYASIASGKSRIAQEGDPGAIEIGDTGQFMASVGGDGTSSKLYSESIKESWVEGRSFMEGLVDAASLSEEAEKELSTVLKKYGGYEGAITAKSAQVAKSRGIPSDKMPSMMSDAVKFDIAQDEADKNAPPDTKAQFNYQTKRFEYLPKRGETVQGPGGNILDYATGEKKMPNPGKAVLGMGQKALSYGAGAAGTSYNAYTGASGLMPGAIKGLPSIPKEWLQNAYRGELFDLDAPKEFYGNAFNKTKDSLLNTFSKYGGKFNNPNGGSY